MTHLRLVRRAFHVCLTHKNSVTYNNQSQCFNHVVYKISDESEYNYDLGLTLVIVEKKCFLLSAYTVHNKKKIYEYLCESGNEKHIVKCVIESR